MVLLGLFLASIILPSAWSGGYYDVTPSTTVGTSTMALAGYFGVASGSTTIRNYKVYMEGLTPRVYIATTSYGGNVATVTLYVTSNVVVSNTNGDNCVIYSTGSIACKTYTNVLTSAAGTTNTVAKYTSATAIGNSQIVDDGTNVSVGGGPRSFLLDVNGIVRSAGLLRADVGITLGGNQTINSSSGYIKLAPTTHIEYNGTAPTVTACGTSPSVVTGNDHIGFVTTGTLTPTQCTINFSSNWTNAPTCHCNIRDINTRTCSVESNAIGSFRMNFSAGISSTVVDYICLGYQ